MWRLFLPRKWSLFVEVCLAATIMALLIVIVVHW